MPAGAKEERWQPDPAQPMCCPAPKASADSQIEPASTLLSALGERWQSDRASRVRSIEPARASRVVRPRPDQPASRPGPSSQPERARLLSRSLERARLIGQSPRSIVPARAELSRPGRAGSFGQSPWSIGQSPWSIEPARASHCQVARPVAPVDRANQVEQGRSASRPGRSSQPERGRSLG